VASRTVNLVVSDELVERIDGAAKAEGRTRSEWIREAARERLEKRPQRKDSSWLLSRLAALAVKGPKVSEKDIDEIIYRGRKPR